MSTESNNFGSTQTSEGLRERLEEKNQGFNEDSIYWRGEYTFVQGGKEETIYFPDDGWLELDRSTAEKRVSEILEENENKNERHPYEVRRILEDKSGQIYPDELLEANQIPPPQSVTINRSHLNLADIFTDRSGLSYSSYSESFRGGANVDMSSLV